MSMQDVTSEQIREEAVFRVDARHRGLVSPTPAELADEYDREALYVASLARQFPWAEVVSRPCQLCGGDGRDEHSVDACARCEGRGSEPVPDALDAATGETRR